MQARRQYNEACGEDTQFAPLGFAGVPLDPYQVSAPDCIVHVPKGFLVQSGGPALLQGCLASVTRSGRGEGQVRKGGDRCSDDSYFQHHMPAVYAGVADYMLVFFIEKLLTSWCGA